MAKIVSTELTAWNHDRSEGFRIAWAAQYAPGEFVLPVGFGQLDIFVDKLTGSLKCDSETLSHAQVKEILHALVESAEFIG